MAKRQDFTAEPATGHMTLPRQEPGSTERQPITGRLRPGLRDRMWQQAFAERRSLNTMLNELIERGLAADRAHADIFGSPAGFAVARALIAAAEATATRGDAGGEWIYDAEKFDRAAAAITQMLTNLRPTPAAQEALDAVAEARRQKRAR
jgi:hypothetical protein